MCLMGLGFVVLLAHTDDLVEEDTIGDAVGTKGFVDSIVDCLMLGLVDVVDGLG